MQAMTVMCYGINYYATKPRQHNGNQKLQQLASTTTSFLPRDFYQEND